MEWRPSPSPCTSATHASADSTSPKAANAATTGCRGRSSSRGTGSSCSSSTGKHDASATWHSISGRPPARNTLSGKHSRQAPGASSARRHDDRTDAAADDEPAATAGRHDAQSSAFSAAAGIAAAASSPSFQCLSSDRSKLQLNRGLLHSPQSQHLDPKLFRVAECLPWLQVMLGRSSLQGRCSTTEWPGSSATKSDPWDSTWTNAAASATVPDQPDAGSAQQYASKSR